MIYIEAKKGIYLKEKDEVILIYWAFRPYFKINAVPKSKF